LPRGAYGLTLAALLAWVGAVAACAPRPQAVHHRVAIRGMTFEPHTLRVAQGDTVTWVNQDIVPHTVTGAGDRWDSGEVAPAGRFTWVVGTDGTVGYECRYHPMMTAELVVE